MKTTMSERGQVTIPKTIRERAGFMAKTEVEIDLKDGVVTLKPYRDKEKFEAAIKKWYGSGKERMKELGFETTDELIEALRGR